MPVSPEPAAAHVADLAAFVQASPTSFHAAAEGARQRVEPFVQGHGISVALIRATMIAHILCLDVRVVQVVHHAEQTAVTMAALFLLAYCHVVMISQTLELFCRSVAQRCLLPSTMG